MDLDKIFDADTTGTQGQELGDEGGSRLVHGLGNLSIELELDLPRFPILSSPEENHQRQQHEEAR